MNTAWDGISIIDEEGRFTYMNDAYAAVFGYDPADLLGESWTIVYPEQLEARVHNDIMPTVDNAGTWTGETTLQRANGEAFAGAHAVASLAEGGAVCVVRDHTERQELNRELRHERDRFRLLVEAVEEYAIFMLDTEGRVVSWNAGAERIEGYEADEIIGEHLSIFYPDDIADGGLPDQLLERAAEQGSTTDQGLRVRKDDSTFWADVTITALYTDGDLQGYGKVTEDITEQVERERREERNEEYRRELYEITSDPGRDLGQTVDDLLDLGVERLDVANAFIAFIDEEGDRHEFVTAADPHPSMLPGSVGPLSGTFCRRAIESDEILGVADTVVEGWSGDPAYEEYGFSCYLGAKLELEDELIGTVCFIDWTPRSEKFRHDEKAFVHMLARWLTYELRTEDRRNQLRARNA